MALKYTGDPRTDWLPGVPARDLTDDEAKRWPQAAAAAFYTDTTKKKRRATAQNGSN